jgi:hypothetical protein
MLNVMIAECHKLAFHADCHYAECRGVNPKVTQILRKLCRKKSFIGFILGLISTSKPGAIPGSPLRQELSFLGVKYYKLSCKLVCFVVKDFSFLDE